MDFFEGGDHLLHAGNFGVDDVIGEQDGEGLVADELLGHEDGVSETEGFRLTGVGDLGEPGDGSRDLEEPGFSAGFKRCLELERLVEMIFHGRLSAASHDDDFGAAGGDSFFNAVLDQGLVDECKHLLGRCLRSREEPCSHACGGKDCFADGLGGHGESFLHSGDFYQTITGKPRGSV